MGLSRIVQGNGNSVAAVHGLGIRSLVAVQAKRNFDTIRLKISTNPTIGIADPAQDDIVVVGGVTYKFNDSSKESIYDTWLEQVSEQEREA